MWIVTWSPGFMSSVCELGVKVAVFASCGLGAPVGTPLFWMNAKFTGSSQFALHVANPSVHSRLSMVSAAHQCVVSQPELSTKGGSPGGYSCISMNVEPPPLEVLVGALESEL